MKKLRNSAKAGCEVNVLRSALFLAMIVAANLSACDEHSGGVDMQPGSHHLSSVAQGWAQTSVNATIFRKNSLVTHEQQQYIGFYSDIGEVMLGKRALNTDTWEVSATGHYGRPTDAHNSISIMVDGAGYLHMSWDHHIDNLRYVRSLAPESLNPGPMMEMIGTEETAVTYPEFHRLPSGDLLFAYRDGSSGNGKMIINRYDHALMRWQRIQSNLLDGEGERNAYWQMHIALNGTIHLSWVWRESSDVATNHDMHYARSDDDGESWQTLSGENYQLPITQQSAEIVWRIEENSNLINQTSMTSDIDGTPYIATYYRDKPSNATQIRVIYPIVDAGAERQSTQWTSEVVSNRQSDFDLSGGGSKSLPISRPQIISASSDGTHRIHIIYRDSEHGDRAIVASKNFTNSSAWRYTTLTEQSVERWEPSFDSELWKHQSRLHLYLQAVGQIDAEGVDATHLPTVVQVLEVALPSEK